MNAKPMTCLIVDDDATGREIASEMVRELGFEPVTAYDGRHALEIYDRKHPDVILVDMYMPEMDGVDFIKVMRKKEAGDRLNVSNSGKRNRTVVIMCSADERCNLMKKLSGTDDYMTKPFHVEHIRDKFIATGLIAEFPEFQVVGSC